MANISKFLLSLKMPIAAIAAGKIASTKTKKEEKFDPDAYLAEVREKELEEFDPDAYIAENKIKVKTRK